MLHKTQSAKNLGDLNTFLRDFMLDSPQTFGIGFRSHGDASEAHAAARAAERMIALKDEKKPEQKPEQPAKP